MSRRVINTDKDGEGVIPAGGDELERYVLENGCFTPEENARIYFKWFKDAPRYLFRAVDRKYGLTRMKLCDLGCSYGMNLLHCADGSYGIEMDPGPAAFARSLSLEVYERNFADDDISDLPRVDAVWCCAVLEHVDSPHVFLRRIHQVLRPKGLLALYVPTVPVFTRWGFGSLPWMRRFLIGHLASDHVNAFTPATLRFFCERAGFETVEVSPFFPPPFAVFNRVPFIARLVDGCMYIGRTSPDWEYYPRATRRRADNPRGYVSRNEKV